MGASLLALAKSIYYVIQVIKSMGTSVIFMRIH